MYYSFFKRILDIIIALFALIILVPIFFIIGFLILFKLGRPVIFKQTRPGKNTMPFQMFKFRTMTNDMDSEGKLLPNEKRLTRFGRILRGTSLDELPELINVLKGDMSLVGPRPLRMKYIPLYTDNEMRRHDVKPGITGWAQVNGRNQTTWDDRLKYDVWYVDNLNFFLDLKILLLTIIKILKREGIEPQNSVFLRPLEEVRKKRI